MTTVNQRSRDAIGNLWAYLVSRQIGKVTDTDPLTVRVAGVERKGYQTLDHYDPQVDDRVFVLRNGNEPPVIVGIFGDYAGGGGGGGIELDDANTFTTTQTIDMGATGNALNLDVHTGGGEKWINFTEGGTLRGYISELVDFINFRAESSMLLNAVGDIILSPGGVINASSKRIEGVADATGAKHAMNRDASDARYQPLDSDLTSIAALTTTTYGRAVLALADAAALRTAAGLVIGTDVQAYDADLADYAANDLGTCHAPASIVVPNTANMTANRGYWQGVVIPRRCTLTGIQYLCNSAAGAVNSALFDASGTRVANSTANLTCAGSNAPQRVPFDSTYNAAPGVYYMYLVFSSTNNVAQHNPATLSGFGAGPGGGATHTSLTPPTSTSATRVPTMSTY